jgi:predicted RNA-binding protein with PUA domain
MSEYKFKLNYEGVGQLLKSSQVQDVLKKNAEQVQQNCGDLASEYKVNTRVGSTRAYASVCTDSVHAINSNLKHNTLLKALT